MHMKQPTLSDQLRRLVESSGITMYRLSKETGIHTSALSRFLSGERFLSEGALNALGEHLGLRMVKARPAKRNKKGR